MNTVGHLKEIHFLQLTLAEKLQIKTKGRHCPDLAINSIGSSNGKPYKRNFNRSFYEKYNWLTGCNKTNALYCFPCLLYGGEPAWTSVGMTDLNHLTRNLKIHATSNKHLNNIVDLSYLE